MADDDALDSARRLAHDLRNVLVSLQSLAMLIERVLSPRDVELAGHLALAAERAASLSRQIADGESDLVEGPRPGCSRLATTLRRSRPMLERVADPVPVDLHVEEQPGEITLSEESLERIAINLVRNARRAAGPSGAIEVTARRHVDETGSAWDTLTVVHADPAASADRAWTRLPDGEPRPGLGLTIVRELATWAGGRVELWLATDDALRVVCVFPVLREA
jgi:nitrogen-specific signal transduction histidine kinase